MFNKKKKVKQYDRKLITTGNDNKRNKLTATLESELSHCYL